MTPTRAAIVGTAGTYTLTPWDDPGLYIVGLNDGYTLPNVKRFDEWFELHPWDHFWYRKKDQREIKEGEVPEGSYIRPEGHLEWLKAFATTHPVWLKDAPPADWPVNAQRFPIEQMEAKYGTYWASGPSYELMHLYDRGFREIHIYGIHLATQAEYIHQRPNFEALIRGVLGPEVKEHAEGALRIYDGSNGVRIVLPKAAPILQHGWKYAYEPKPQRPDKDAIRRMQKIQQEMIALDQQLLVWPRWKSKAAPLARRARLKAEFRDAQMQARHAVISATKSAA